MADLDRVALADALIADILTPYLLHSCPELIQSIGRESFACAQCLYREIGEVCARDDKARRTLELFEEDPLTYSSVFGLVLQRLLAQDESWALAVQQQIIAFTASVRGDSTIAGSGAIAASGGAAAGERGVAVRGVVAGGIHIYEPPAGGPGEVAAGTPMVCPVDPAHYRRRLRQKGQRLFCREHGVALVPADSLPPKE
jgi:hypothetical protein